MKKFVAAVAVGGAIVVGAIGLNNVIPAGAQTAPATSSSTSKVAPRLRHHEFRVAAKTIGVAPTELRSDLQAGQSVADVATAHNVPVDTVVNAVVTDATAKIEQAAGRGVISHDKATTLEGKLPTLVTNAVNRHPAPHTAG